MITKLLNEVNEKIETLNNLVQDKEYFEKLDKRIEKVNNYVQEQKQEIERLNNIINKFEKHLEQTIIKFTQFNEERCDINVYIYYTEKLLLKLQELKGSDK